MFFWGCLKVNLSLKILNVKFWKLDLICMCRNLQIYEQKWNGINLDVITIVSHFVIGMAWSVTPCGMIWFNWNCTKETLCTIVQRLHNNKTMYLKLMFIDIENRLLLPRGRGLSKGWSGSLGLVEKQQSPIV